MLVLMGIQLECKLIIYIYRFTRYVIWSLCQLLISLCFQVGQCKDNIVYVVMVVINITILSVYRRL